MTKNRLYGPLSTDGQNRREELGAELKSVFVNHHRKRQTIKWTTGIGVACIALIGVSILVAAVVRDQQPKDQIAKPVDVIDGSNSDLVIAQAPIEKREDRFRQVSFEVIDDEQLLAMLEDYGQPSMLAKVDGQKVVIPLQPNSSGSLN